MIFLPYVLAVAMASGAPADEGSGAQAKAQNADVASRLVDQFYDLMYDNRYSEALAIAKRIKIDDDNREGRATLDAMRATALFALKRDGEARRLVAKADESAPQSPEPAEVLFLTGVAIDRIDVAADALDKLLVRFPDIARDLDRDSIRYFLRNEPKDQVRRNDDRRIQLARIHYGGDLDGDYIAARAVDILIDRGDPGAAAQFVKNIDNPVLFENMLIERRYAALWPKLVELGGPHLSKIRASSVASSNKVYAEKPDDHEALQSYAQALAEGGRLGDSAALAARLPQSSTEMADADEQMGWAVNNVAYALYRSGKPGEADRYLELLNHAQIANGSWRVSMIINRLEMIMLAGQFDKTATLLAEAEASARNDGSDYARQLVRRMKYCTLSRLGRKTEAAAIRKELIDHANDALAATVGGLVCAGELDAAEELALRGLKDPSLDRERRLTFEGDFVRALQPVPLTSDDPSVWDSAWRVLRQRPAIAKEYERLGRDMPPEFLPPKPDAAVVK